MWSSANNRETEERERLRLRRKRMHEEVKPPQFRRDNQLAQSVIDPAWLISGPAETGKTWAALWRLDTEARKHKGSQWILARKIRTTMNSTVLKTWKKIIAIRGGVTVFGGENPQWYDYTENGARVWVVGFDNADKILSGEFDGAVVNQAEELDEPDFETLTTRCTGRGAVTPTPMVWGDCNPGPEDHWIQRRKASGTLRLLETTHEDNPSLHDGNDWTEQGVKSLSILDRLTGVRYLRLRLGRWVGAEGQYFDQWDENLHLCDPFPIPDDWPIWGAFDYGFTHNTAFGLYTKHDGTVYKLGEHVQHKWLPVQHAPAMDGLCFRLGIDKARISRVVAGLDVFQSKGDKDGKTIADQYQALGWHFSPAAVDRITGAQEMSARLGNAEANVPATFKIVRTCVQTIATLPRMVHDPNRPEDVLKVDSDAEGRGGDDCYDETRYGLMNARTTWLLHEEEDTNGS